jgi:hypothetical protein
MNDVILGIADLRALIMTPHREALDVVRDRYKGFLSSGSADWLIDIDVRAVLGDRPHDDVLVARDGRPGRFVVTRADFAGIVDLAIRRARVTLRQVNEYSIDSFLRILYSLALLEARGLVMHAASLVRNGRARVFAGKSGSGKTTVARLSTDATLLSDELSIVRMTDEGARSYGTPFWGELARAGQATSAPLSGIYFLRHGRQHVATRLTPRQAVERLLPNVVFFARDADLTARVLEIAAELVDAVPSFDLAFRPDAGFWEVIDRA